MNSKRDASRGLDVVSTEIYQVIANESPNMIFINQGGKIVYVNKKCEDIMEYTRREFCSAGFDFLSLVSPESREFVSDAFHKHLNGSEVPPYEYSLVAKSGKKLDVIITTRLIDYRGSPAILGIVTEITQLKRIENLLRDSQQQYRLTIDSLADLIYVIDNEYRIVLVNESCRHLHSKYGKELDVIGKRAYSVCPFWTKKSKAEYEKVFAGGGVSITEESVMVRGEKIFLHLRKIPVYENGTVKKIVTVARDITQTRNTETALKELNRKLAIRNRRLKTLTLTDSHTGLYNHRFLADVLVAQFAYAKRESRPFSVLMLDIDYFKSINDVYGHQFGDIVLKQFADILKKIVRRTSVLIRYGGEEFVIVLPDTNRAEALQAAHRLLEEVSIHTFGRDNNRIKLKISVAAAAYPEDHAVKESDILELADQALSKAKELGGNRVYSTLDLHTPVGALHRSKNDHPEIKYLKEKMERLNKRANQSLIEAISAFAKTIELKDHYTGEHVERTVHFATEIAMEIGLSREEVHSIRQAAILHDLGKVGISEKILRKPAKLTPREFKEIKEHPLIGADIIRPIHMLHDILPFILYHHERWDGKGYPMGLKGEEIPIGARIISIADTWQALISNRPYRKAFGRKEALGIMKECCGTQFDPDIASAFFKVLEREI
ncbi:MAG: hypothetical protein A2219_00070 [Elusimicrobia bacterium RIFOXYA2_FULL_50_26]|nr:MAG: hypothetical protein A2219_00070 [Elusimicrobia bacterium RIFOXYA2_FULL_50_26]OGS22745.1 MAG: hypothetical protein A2314_00435 [Elusimicrobia bacterium RIFOXYB2_FULL_50_12]